MTHRKILSRIVIAVLSTLATLTALEGVFRFVPASHNVGSTRASSIWDDRFWKPVNAYGHRDQPMPPDIGDGQAVFIVGDSFAAGHGIADVERRFANILRSRLPERSVVCLAQRGWNTLDEIDFLQHFRHKPKTLVLVYTFNDIEQRAAYEGSAFEGFRPYEDVPAWARGWVRSSYLLNYMYWLFPHGDMDGYAEHLRRCYSDTRIVSKHLLDLQYFMYYARQNGADLVAVLFPSLAHPESEALMAPVKRLFIDHGVETVDVGESIRGIPREDLMVGKNDAHPNERLHALVAEEILRRLEKMKDPKRP